MKKISLTLTLLAVALLNAACTSAPTTSLLDQVRNDYRAVQASPMAAAYAPLETKQAGDALALANTASDQRESPNKIDHLAYIAQQKITLTREVIKQKSAEAEIANAGKQRDQLLLDQRTAEADRSKLKAQIANNEAAEAKQGAARALAQAADAKRSTLTAQNEATEAKQGAARALAQAADAKRSTLTAQNEATEAKQGAARALAQAADAKRSTLTAQNEAAAAKKGAQAASNDVADAQRKAQEAQDHSARLEAQLSALAAKKTARGVVITLSDVLFGTDLARLSAEGMRSAQKLVTLLQDNPQRTVLIEGFTDSTGSTAHNQGLSERRANAVRSALADMGIAQERIAVRGYGEEFPVVANDSADHRQLNRRVEIVLSDDQGVINPR